MGVTKELLKEGNGTDRPAKGDNILMEYTGWLSDPSAANGRGKE
jgi:FK506-binding protein 1